MDTQICSTCQVEKPMTDYPQRKRQCRECRNKKAKETYKANREYYIAQKQLWKLDNDERLTHPKKCECGSEVQACNFNKHTKSKKHQDFINGLVKETKEIISYRGADNNYKKKFIRVSKEVFKQFHDVREGSWESNYKILKELCII